MPRGEESIFARGRNQRRNGHDHDASKSWGEPDLEVLQLRRRPPPAFPIEVFDEPWGEWINQAREAAACPPDYVAMPLLALASVLLGNARWPEASMGWSEPPFLWVASIGDSGSGKSPGSDALLRDVLPELERRMVGDYPDRLQQWRAAQEHDQAHEERWKSEVRDAQNRNTAPPLPPRPTAGPEPESPRLRQNDITIEKVASMLCHAAPKGLLIVRDELYGWISGMGSYNQAGPSFWLESYGGRPYRVERQKLAEPIVVPRLGVAVFGGTQPDKIAALMSGPDDGLLARFLWSWPNQVEFDLGRRAPGIAWATEALDKLRILELLLDAGDANQARPILVPLEPPAVEAMREFGRQMQTRQAFAGGRMRSALGKARGHALRLSIVLELLWWCARETIQGPPTRISLRAFTAATQLMRDYFVPMAERVYGDAAVTHIERNASTIAAWIARDRPDEVYVRQLQREVRLPGLRAAHDIRAACDFLVEADWLEPPPKTEFGQPRARVAYAINPALWRRLDDARL